MLVQQLSVFLETRPGQLAAFTKMLAENRIDLHALSIAETQDYGVPRIIVDKPQETAELLTAEGWPCTVTEVLAVTVPDEPGSLTRLLSILAENDISLAYCYAFFERSGNAARVVLRVADNEKAARLLNAAGIEC